LKASLDRALVITTSDKEDHSRKRKEEEEESQRRTPWLIEEFRKDKTSI
jgi:hypothetical protein